VLVVKSIPILVTKSVPVSELPSLANNCEKGLRSLEIERPLLTTRLLISSINDSSLNPSINDISLVSLSPAYRVALSQ